MPVLARTLTAIAVRGPMRRAAAVYLGLAIVASVLFAPNALRASDVTAAAEAFPPARGILLALWLVLTGTVARELIEVPGAAMLRALPVPRWWFWTVQSLHLLVAELPWAVLWWAGAGLLAGASAALLAVAAHALLVLRPRRWPEWAGAAVVLACVLLPLPPLLLLVASAGAAAWAVPAAWRHSWERRRVTWRRRVGGPAVTALALSYGLRLLRTEPATAVRSGALVLAAVAVVALAVINNDVVALDSLMKIALGVSCPVLLVASGGIADVILRMESADRWLLDALGVSRTIRGLGAIAVPAVLAGLGGAVLGATALAGAARLPVGGGWLLPAAAAWGSAFGVVALGCRRWVAAGTGREGSRTLLVVVAVAVPADLLLVHLGPPALAVAMGAGLLAGVRYAQRTGGVSDGQALSPVLEGPG